MQNFSLDFVKRPCEIRSNIAYFNQKAAASNNNSRVRKLLTGTTYWLYDEATDTFGPSKFVGFKSMTFECYDYWVERAKTHKGKFLGESTRRANENTLGKRFVLNANLLEKLLKWGKKLFDGAIFKKVKQSKWRFIQISK